MSSGRIGMILTYTKHKNDAPRTPASRAAPAPAPRQTNPTITYSRMNRFSNVSMHNIIHKPSSGCSSCGN